MTDANARTPDARQPNAGSTNARATTERQTMAEVSHVHRYDPGASTRFYSRGPPAYTDGGEHESLDDEEGEEDEEHESGDQERPTMKDVSHTPPAGDREVNRVFERGSEGTVDRR